MDYRPSGVVYEVGGRLHQPQGLLVEEMIGGRGAFARTQQRNMYADEVGSAQSILESYVLDPVLIFGDAAGVAQVHVLLNSVDVIMILVGGVVAQHVHVEAGTVFDHGQADAAGADDGDGFAGDFVAEKRQVGVPISPLIVTGEVLGRPHFARQHAKHEEGELGGGL